MPEGAALVSGAPAENTHAPIGDYEVLQVETIDSARLRPPGEALMKLTLSD